VAIRWQGRLEAGETLLVLGAAGGVGLTAVEIGKAMGARVIAGASTPRSSRVGTGARGARGDQLRDENLTERVMALTGDRGADVCFDPVGGELADAALSSLGWGGRMLLVGFVGGVQQIPANRLLVKNRSRSAARCATIAFNAPDKLARVGAGPHRLVRGGKLKPHVSHRLPSIGRSRRSGC